MKKLLPFRFILAFAGLLTFFVAVTCIDVATADGDGTRAQTISSTPSDEDLAQSLQVSATASEYTSSSFTADFEFNGVGVVWTGPASAQVDFAVAIDGGAWQALEMTGDEAKDQAEAFTSLPLFVTGRTVQYKITGPDYAQVRNVRLTYFDSTVAPQPSMLQSLHDTLERSLQSSPGNVPIISRADWGADESYRTWAPDYSAPKKIVIHHTAGGNGGADPAATIRGIYYWQAVVLGWGDIGYNYLMDQQGNVYEGRYGGSGVIGAHAYNSETDTNYNVSSIGIALLGCFESTTGSCATTSTYTETMHTALTQFLGQLTVAEKIDPLGQKKWYGQKLPNILSHRDIDYTYCPGDLIYGQLEQIRQDTAATYNLLQSTTPKAYQAKWLSQTLSDTYLTTDQPTVDFVYNNVGQKAWSTDNVVLQVSIAETNIKQRVVLPTTTPPNQTTTFSPTLTISPTKAGTYTMVSKLYHSGQVIKGSTHRTTITLTQPYQATITDFSLPLAIRQGWKPTLSLTVQNTGTQDWPVGTQLEVNQQPLKALQQPLAVGDSKTFTLHLDAASDWPVGSNTVTIRFQTDQTTIPGSRLSQALRIDP